MNFDELPTIPAGHLFRAAMVSEPRGERAIRELTAAGAIKPMRTPTGRVLLSPADGRRVFDAIVRAA